MSMNEGKTSALQTYLEPPPPSEEAAVAAVQVTQLEENVPAPTTEITSASNYNAVDESITQINDYYPANTNVLQALGGPIGTSARLMFELDLQKREQLDLWQSRMEHDQ